MDDFNGIHADEQQRHVNKLDAPFGWSFKAHPAAPSSQSFYTERKAHGFSRGSMSQIKLMVDEHVGASRGIEPRLP